VAEPSSNQDVEELLVEADSIPSTKEVIEEEDSQAAAHHR